MEDTTINSYLNNFRRNFAPYLKDKVGVKSIIFPYSEGTLIVFELGTGISSDNIKRGQSQSLREALSRTNLFEGKEDLQAQSGTSILLLKDKIVLIKGDSSNLWTDSAAQKDVVDIIEQIRG